MKRSFKGVAYWTVATSATDWAVKAVSTLLPIETAGLGEVGYECLATGDQVTVTFDEDRHEMLINRGQGRGVVCFSRTSCLFLVCLVALRKSVGDIDIVDDGQQQVPAVLRQSYPLFGEDWNRIVPVAQAVGLLPDPRFAARYGALLNQVI